MNNTARWYSLQVVCESGKRRSLTADLLTQPTLTPNQFISNALGRLIQMGDPAIDYKFYEGQ